MFSVSLKLVYFKEKNQSGDFIRMPGNQKSFYSQGKAQIVWEKSGEVREFKDEEIMTTLQDDTMSVAAFKC